MARYADQLPINWAPNGANFLLSTNDSDGKALERISWNEIYSILLGIVTPTQTANYTANPFEKIPLDSSAGGFTVTLPDNGIIWLFDDQGTISLNPVTLSPPAGQTVNGAASYSLATNQGVWQFQLIGTNWVKFYG